MKLLSIVIPSYNSEKYLEDCLSSLLFDIDDLLDVIVVNDGSTDATSQIAHEFANKHPFVRVIDKENGGHGSGINKGLEIAEGLYFKVLDSDDHLDKEGLFNLINLIKKHQQDNCLPDVYMADYLSVNVEDGNKKASSLSKKFPKIEEIIDIKDIKNFNRSEYFMIHMLFVKTELLKSTHLHLLEKTFYEDNQYNFHIIKYANTFCYLSKPIYLYSIGRMDQSVSMTSIDKNFRHQVRVMDTIATSIPFDEYKTMNKRRRWHILHELYIVEVLTYFYIYIMPTKEKKAVYFEYIKHFKKENPKIYWRLKHNTLVFFIWYAPPFMRSLITKSGYKFFGKRKGWTF